jgi:CubicO group peptidase (beta-lactamase class C family)
VFQQGITGAWFAEHGMVSGAATEAGKLKPATTVYPLLGFSHPADPRGDTITIQQFLDHTVGYDDSASGSGFDPTYNMRTIALALGLSNPVTKLDVARYVYGRPLDFTPGTANHYSNFGYLLAGAVVEHVSGMTYVAHVNKTLLQPAGINEVQVISTLARCAAVMRRSRRIRGWVSVR